MFAAFFCRRVVRRLRADAQAEILEGFLSYLYGRGHARTTIQLYIRQAELFVRWLRRRRQLLAAIDEATARAFACRNAAGRRPKNDNHAAIRHLLRHLRERGMVGPRAKAGRPDVDRVVTEYDEYLQRVCGFAPATRASRRFHIRGFLEFAFRSRRISWTRIRPLDIRSYVSQFGRSGRVAAARTAATSLRSFLRWQQCNGNDVASLVAAVPGFRQCRLTGLPTALTDDQLRTFLASFDRSRPTGRRDYAMALCMVELGLRVSSVADLMIDDVNEAHDTLRLSAGKSRRKRELPMPKRVRQAVLNYIRRDRPKTDDRHLFVRHRIPIGVAVSRELIRGVMRRAYAVVPGCEHWTGTHVLRNTAATRLHRSGADLKRVADILGHASIDTTAIYAKVDMTRLTQVALPWPGKAEVQP